MENSGPSFDVIGEQQVNTRPVDEPVRDDIVEGARLRQEGEKAIVTGFDHRREHVELAKKLLPPAHDAFVVKRHVVPRFNRATPFNCLLEVLEIGPVIASPSTSAFISRLIISASA